MRIDGARCGGVAVRYRFDGNSFERHLRLLGCGPYLLLRSYQQRIKQTFALNFESAQDRFGGTGVDDRGPQRRQVSRSSGY
jgi:hypothetical protein